jgi:hypothetical protein
VHAEVYAAAPRQDDAYVGIGLAARTSLSARRSIVCDVSSGPEPHPMTNCSVVVIVIVCVVVDARAVTLRVALTVTRVLEVPPWPTLDLWVTVLVGAVEVTVRVLQQYVRVCKENTSYRCAYIAEGTTVTLR